MILEYYFAMNKVHGELHTLQQEVEQLRKTRGMTRARVSDCVKDLIQYCEQESGNDALLVGFWPHENLYRPKPETIGCCRLCCALLCLLLCCCDESKLKWFFNEWWSRGSVVVQNFDILCMSLRLPKKITTLYHTMPTFNDPEKEAFWKHCGKRRKCW